MSRTKSATLPSLRVAEVEESVPVVVPMVKEEPTPEATPAREEKIIGIHKTSLPFSVQEVEGHAKRNIQLYLTAYEAKVLTGYCLQLVDEDAVLANGKRVERPIDALRYWLQQLGRAALIKQ